jgi:osmotically-inducible protein OsmY
MHRSAKFAAALMLVLAGATMAACTATPTRESAGEYVDDSVISTKVRAQIFGDKDLKLTQIDVETFKGAVQLSGFVDSATAKPRTGDVAAQVAGVTRVHKNLVVK